VQQRGIDWNFGDLLDAVAQVVPGARPALVHGARCIDWAAFTQRTNNLARALSSAGAAPGDKIGFYMRNQPAYVESIAAAFKARLTHVNVNYRYVDDELVYLLDNADAVAVVYAREFASRVAAIRPRLPGVRLWIEVADDTGGRAISRDAAVQDYETLVETGAGQPLELTRSGDDLLFLYTGGTTGMPKGVMWRQDDLWRVMGAGGNPRLGIPPATDLAEHVARTVADAPPVTLPLPPLMHGTGLLAAVGAMVRGGTCITLTGRSFDPEEALVAIEQHRVTHVTLVGDAFAAPLVKALDAAPGRHDFSSVRFINSSGVMWTRAVKAGLLRHNDALMLADAFSSSEAIGLGASVMTRDQSVEVAKFALGPSCKVFTEDFREVVPGSGETGMVAVSGYLPVGYYKDPEKTARTFPVIDGVRYSVPGDWVRVEADGSLTLLGRGSNCINTAGEKVYPEEVEEALKHHPDVVDALVVGLPDEKWGQSITAVVQLVPGVALDESSLRTFVQGRIAGYKVPKRLFARDDLERAPNGKANYALIRDYAAALVAAG
jgi:fatty-acyl-CoA synthase